MIRYQCEVTPADSMDVDSDDAEDADEVIEFTLNCSPDESSVCLDADAVAALVAQCQSWLARVNHPYAQAVTP